MAKLSNIFATLAFVSAIAASCIDEHPTPVLDYTNLYTTAQLAGDISYFSAGFSPNLTYTENDKATDIYKGILTKPLNLSHTRSIFDWTACATYTELIANASNPPYVIGTQLRFRDIGGNGTWKITRMESIITKPGDWLFNASTTQYWAEKESWTTIPEDKRDTRDMIQKAADAYLNRFNDKNVTVPWGTPCARLEGGAYTGRGLANDSCAVGVPSGVPITDRRYVIDESVGTVDVFNKFGQSKWPDTHEFRIEGGKLRYVHTMTMCGIPNCGVNSTMTSKRFFF